MSGKGEGCGTKRPSSSRSGGQSSRVRVGQDGGESDARRMSSLGATHCLSPLPYRARLTYWRLTVGDGDGGGVVVVVWHLVGGEWKCKRTRRCLVRPSCRWGKLSRSCQDQAVFGSEHSVSSRAFQLPALGWSRRVRWAVRRRRALDHLQRCSSARSRTGAGPTPRWHLNIRCGLGRGR